jgi:hypothetical protein
MPHAPIEILVLSEAVFIYVASERRVDRSLCRQGEFIGHPPYPTRLAQRVQ